MAKTRITLDADDFQRLVRGHVVEIRVTCFQLKVEILLQDVGFLFMEQTIERARTDVLDKKSDIKSYFD